MNLTVKNLPNWIPGTGFKRTAARWNKTLMQVADQPYEFVKKQVSEGTAKPSYVQAFIDKKGAENMTAEEEFIAKWSAASLYTGGADTTVSSIACFFLAMALNPLVQKKAQEELDRVIGTDRLPSFSDREDLPYINALLKEVLRWHPVAPMGLPHVVTEDDIYEGHFIPKGAMLMPNIYGFMHNPKTFKNPNTFNPDRFLGPNPEMDTHTLCFGFGRRICPGRELADSSVFLRSVFPSQSYGTCSYFLASRRFWLHSASRSPSKTARRSNRSLSSCPESSRTRSRTKSQSVLVARRRLRLSSLSRRTTLSRRATLRSSRACRTD